jgi:hypothetical protein
MCVLGEPFVSFNVFMTDFIRINRYAGSLYNVNMLPYRMELQLYIVRIPLCVRFRLLISFIN